MRILCSLLLLLAVAGCLAPGGSALTHLDFRLRGKIAVRTEQEAFSAAFDWRQAGRRYQIDLWGPLGQGHIRLRGDGSTLSLTDSGGAVWRGDDAVALMDQTLGWSVPTTALRHWVRGRYDPSLPATPLAEQEGADDERLHQFEQLGWTVRASRWRDTAIGPAPGRIVAERNGRRIVVASREWSLD